MTQRDSLTIVHGRRMRSRASFLLVVLAVMDSGCAKTDSKEPPPRYTFEVKIATLPGVGGRLVLNGQTLHEFGAEGSEASSTDAACLFRAGENTLDWEIRHLAPDFEAKATTAADNGLGIRLDLYRVPGQDVPAEANRVMRNDYGPTGLGTYSTSFMLGKDQLPDDCRLRERK